MGPLVQVSWLKQNLNHENIIILDATLPKAVAENVAGVSNSQIPGTRFFDIKKSFSKGDAPFPNTRVEEKTFNKKAKDLGVNNDSLIVVYDDHGIYSSARAWWMFKAMGHDQVAVLDGGLKSWLEAGYNIEEKIEISLEKGNFEGIYKKEFFKESDSQSTCPWKGLASYYTLTVEGKENKDAAWYYPEVSELARTIKGRVAFWKGVRIEK